MKRLSIFLMFCAFAFISCEEEKPEQIQQRYYQSAGEAFQKGLWYWKDWATGVCFSMHGSPESYGFSHATVPCTPEVEAVLING